MPNVFLEGLQRPAILQNNSGLPDYSEANDGDVLQIASGEPTWGAVDALPEIEETDEGKVLAVDQGEAVWADAPSGLPEITSSDEGKVLTVVPSESEVVPTVIAAEQTVKIAESTFGVNLTATNLDKLTAGAPYTVILNSTTYTGEIEADPRTGVLMFILSEDPTMVLHVRGGYLVFDAPVGTYTIQVTAGIPALTAEWKVVKHNIMIDATSEDPAEVTLITPFSDVLEFQKDGQATITIIYGEGEESQSIINNADLTLDPNGGVQGQAVMWEIAGETSIGLTFAFVGMLPNGNVVIKYANASLDAEIS